MKASATKKNPILRRDHRGNILSPPQLTQKALDILEYVGDSVGELCLKEPCECMTCGMYDGNKNKDYRFIPCPNGKVCKSYSITAKNGYLCSNCTDYICEQCGDNGTHEFGEFYCNGCRQKKGSEYKNLG